MDGSSSSSVTFFDFLDRMRNPASIDLVRSIKSFIVSFSFYAANSDNDSRKLQDFLLTMESAIRDHPLWAGATEEEIDSAIEGLEKYVMTKLFSRTFASSPEDTAADKEILEKINLLQKFLRPEHLDIPPFLHNEASWLLAEKELQKINAFKAPREKLLCILNCCRVINNLLLNAAMTEKCVLAGADDFLPVLIYVTIKAKLVSEEAYYFTNLVSAKSFIADLDAKSLSIDKIEFEESMQAAKLANKTTLVESLPTLDDMAVYAAQIGSVHATRMLDRETNISGGSNYPYMEAEAGELTVADVEKLLQSYKDVVTKYTSLCKAVKHLPLYKMSTKPAAESTGASVTKPEVVNENG